MTNWWWLWCQFFSYRSFLLTDTDICLFLRRHIIISSRHDEDLSSHKCHLKCFTCSVPKDDLDDNDQDDADVWCTWKSFQSPPGGIFGIPPDKPFKDKQKGKKLFLWMKTLIVWLIIGRHCFQFLSQCCLLFTFFQFSFKGEMRDKSFSDRWVFLLRFSISPEPVMVRPAPSSPLHSPWNETFLG